MTFETLTKASEAEVQVTNFAILATLCLIVIGVFVLAETLSEDHDDIELINGDLYRVADAEHCVQEGVADRLEVVDEPNRLYFVVYRTEADSEICVPSAEALGLEGD